MAEMWHFVISESSKLLQNDHISVITVKTGNNKGTLLSFKFKAPSLFSFNHSNQEFCKHPKLWKTRQPKFEGSRTNLQIIFPFISIRILLLALFSTLASCFCCSSAAVGLFVLVRKGTVIWICYSFYDRVLIQSVFYLERWKCKK